MPTTTRYRVNIEATKHNNGKITYTTLSPPSIITGPPVASMGGPPISVMSGPPSGVMPSIAGPPAAKPSSALLQAIKDGTMLKTSNPSSTMPPKTNARTRLLNQLKQGTALKKAEERVLPPKVVKKSALEEEMEKRRQKIAPSQNAGHFKRRSKSRSNRSVKRGGSYRRKTYASQRNRR
jgi:hypothetical protein